MLHSRWEAPWLKCIYRPFNRHAWGYTSISICHFIVYSPNIILLFFSFFSTNMTQRYTHNTYILVFWIQQWKKAFRYIRFSINNYISWNVTVQLYLITVHLISFCKRKLLNRKWRKKDFRWILLTEKQREVWLINELNEFSMMRYCLDLLHGVITNLIFICFDMVFFIDYGSYAVML